MQVVLDEAASIVRVGHGVLVVETKHGFVCANAGVDASNGRATGSVLLPLDPGRLGERRAGGYESSRGWRRR